MATLSSDSPLILPHTSTLEQLEILQSEAIQTRFTAASRKRRKNKLIAELTLQ